MALILRFLTLFVKRLLNNKLFIRKKTNEMDCITPNWLDLPEGIFELIVNKLHFPDQIRSLAVCKTWRACKDHVTCHDSLPWVMRHQLVAVPHEDPSYSVDTLSFICEFVDPYSGRVYKVSDSIQNQISHSLNVNYYDVNGVHLLATKHGWAVFGGGDYSYSINPFNNDITKVYSSLEADAQSTFTGSPISLDCEIFTVVNNKGFFCVDATMRGIESRYTFIRVPEDEWLYSVFYMRENLYCLFWDGVLNRFDFGKESLELVTSGFPEPYESCENIFDCWLMEIEGNLIMARMDNAEDEIYKWIIFKFDWSLMSWVSENALKGCAIYISGKVSFSTPLKNSHGEILENSKLFYLDDGTFKCYSFSDAIWTEIQCEEFSQVIRPEQCELNFMQPPYFRM